MQEERLDMSEFHDAHTAARLIGSPPGYKDSNRGGQLTEGLRRRPYSVVLLDEIEKAAPEVFDLFLQVFDEGRISDAHGRRVDCRHAVFIMKTPRNYSTEDDYLFRVTSYGLFLFPGRIVMVSPFDEHDILEQRPLAKIKSLRELLLKVVGLKLDDLGTKSYGSITENGELIKNRQAMAMGWYTVVPASFVLDVGSSRKLRMVGLTDDTIKKMQALNAGFIRHVVPKGTYAAYGIEEDVVTDGSDQRRLTNTPDTNENVPDW